MNEVLGLIIIGSSAISAISILIWVVSYINSTYVLNQDKAFITVINIVPIILNIVVITILGLKLILGEI